MKKCSVIFSEKTYSENFKNFLGNIHLESYFSEDAIYRDLLKTKFSANFYMYFSKTSKTTNFENTFAQLLLLDEKKELYIYSLT